MAGLVREPAKRVESRPSAPRKYLDAVRDETTGKKIKVLTVSSARVENCVMREARGRRRPRARLPRLRHCRLGTSGVPPLLMTGTWVLLCIAVAIILHRELTPQPLLPPNTLRTPPLALARDGTKPMSHRRFRPSLLFTHINKQQHPRNQSSLGYSAFPTE